VSSKDLVKKREEIEEELSKPGLAMNAKPVSCLSDLSYPLFMVADPQTARW